ncbi:hypothetical protein LA66_00110 [Aureimonas altamirensis]|uniref:Uncharacterized protein n=1 Tax=Aureimonas altamirensis TaxID=370622 RepID=A0A0B1Q8K7_9HYPH|nr:hypothetical protein LA66_00110 [Aureimonas altamirensis]
MTLSNGMISEDDALGFAQLINNRICGWTIVLGMKDGRTDFRRKRARQAHHLMHDLLMNMPCLPAIVDAIQAGDDPVNLWPECLRETVRFQIEHKVPREENEPTSARNRRLRAEGFGCPIPSRFDDHGLQATIADHPPFPNPSPILQTWKREIAADRRRSALRVVEGGRAA